MADTTIICLPHAGAGATVYRSWPPASEVGLRVATIQLPGREERFAEPLTATFADTLADALHQAVGYVEAGPCALFGHSFGAVLAFELARELERAGHPVVRLVVSGSGHPGLPLGRHSAPLPDDAFVAEVEQLAGYTHPALLDPDMRELVLPALRCDVEQHEAYRPATADPIAAPISVYRGESDHLVSAQDCLGWSAWTSTECSQRSFPGGHMYLAGQVEQVLHALAEDCAAGPGGQAAGRSNGLAAAETGRR